MVKFLTVHRANARVEVTPGSGWPRHVEQLSRKAQAAGICQLLFQIKIVTIVSNVLLSNLLPPPLPCTSGEEDPAGHV